jgi:hypothetical protein
MAYILHSQSTKSFSSVTKDNLKSTNNLLGRKKMCVPSFEIETHVSRRVGFEVKEVCVLASQSRAPWFGKKIMEENNPKLLETMAIMCFGGDISQQS